MIKYHCQHRSFSLQPSRVSLSLWINQCLISLILYQFLTLTHVDQEASVQLTKELSSIFTPFTFQTLDIPPQVIFIDQSYARIKGLNDISYLHIHSPCLLYLNSDLLSSFYKWEDFQGIQQIKCKAYSHVSQSLYFSSVHNELWLPLLSPYTLLYRIGIQTSCSLSKDLVFQCIHHKSHSQTFHILMSFCHTFSSSKLNNCVIIWHLV